MLWMTAIPPIQQACDVAEIANWHKEKEKKKIVRKSSINYYGFQCQCKLVWVVCTCLCEGDPKRRETQYTKMVGPMRPQIVLFGSSIVQMSFDNGGWGAILANLYARKVLFLPLIFLRLFWFFEGWFWF